MQLELGDDKDAKKVSRTPEVTEMSGWPLPLTVPLVSPRAPGLRAVPTDPGADLPFFSL